MDFHLGMEDEEICELLPQIKARLHNRRADIPLHELETLEPLLRSIISRRDFPEPDIARETHEIFSLRYQSALHAQGSENTDNETLETPRPLSLASITSDCSTEAMYAAAKTTNESTPNGAPSGSYRAILKSRISRWLSKEQYSNDMMEHYRTGVFKEDSYATPVGTRQSTNSLSREAYNSSVRNNASTTASFDSGYENIYGGGPQDEEESRLLQPKAASTRNQAENLTKSLGNLNVSNPAIASGLRDQVQAAVDEQGLSGQVVLHYDRGYFSFELKPLGVQDMNDYDNDRVRAISNHFSHYIRFSRAGQGRFDSLEEVGWSLSFLVQLPHFVKVSEQNRQSNLDEPDDAVYHGLCDEDRRVFDIVYRLGMQLGFTLRTARIQWQSGPTRCLAFPI